MSRESKLKKELMDIQSIIDDVSDLGEETEEYLHSKDQYYEMTHEEIGRRLGKDKTPRPKKSKRGRKKKKKKKKKSTPHQVQRTSPASDVQTALTTYLRY